MNELHAEYGPKGLHIITLYDQSHPLPQIEDVVAKNKIQYPVATEGYWHEYFLAPSLPMVWIIGVDGKIAFKGASGYDEALEKELAKVKYPGLGRDKVATEVEPAARAFGAGKFAEARKLARAVLDSEAPEAALDDAEYVSDRVDSRIADLIRRAESAEIERNFNLAIACWNELATRYKGCEAADEAAPRLAKLKESKETQKEIEARRGLLALMRELDHSVASADLDDPKVAKPFREKCLAAFEKFAKENEGTWAGERALDYVAYNRELLKELATPEGK